MTLTDLPIPDRTRWRRQHTLALLEARLERGPAARNCQAQSGLRPVIEQSLARRPHGGSTLPHSTSLPQVGDAHLGVGEQVESGVLEHTER